MDNSSLRLELVWTVGLIVEIKLRFQVFRRCVDEARNRRNEGANRYLLFLNPSLSELEQNLLELKIRSIHT